MNKWAKSVHKGFDIFCKITGFGIACAFSFVLIGGTAIGFALLMEALSL